MARPPRPDHEKPVSVSLRIPRELYDEVQARAKLRRTTLTFLVLEGLHLCLDLPLDPRDVPVSHSKTAMQELEALIDARVYAILANEQQRTAVEAPVQPITAFMHDTRIAVIQGHQEALNTQDGNAVMQAQAPTYDATRFVLGELCQNRHDYAGSGQSLRQRGGKRECMECKKMRSRQYKQRQREKRATTQQD